MGCISSNLCHHQKSLISGTIFASTKLPLTTWFLAIYLLIQAKTGLSALALRRQLGVSYNTVWSIKHKIMQVIKEQDDRKVLTGVIQLDDVYWGGEYRGGKRGRGSPNKTPFVAAVSVDEQGHPQKMNLNVVEEFRAKEIEHWAKSLLNSRCHVASDGLSCFKPTTKSSRTHILIVTGGGPECVSLEEFSWVNTMIGNVKQSLGGAYHSIHPKHLTRYLAEFCYRFNRRFDLREILPRFCIVAMRTSPMPQRLLKLAEIYG